MSRLTDPTSHFDERVRAADHVRSKEDRMIFHAACAAADRIAGISFGGGGLLDPAARGAANATAIAEVVEAFEMLDPRWRTKAFQVLDNEQDFCGGSAGRWENHHWKLRAVRNMPGSGLFNVIGASR